MTRRVRRDASTVATRAVVVCVLACVAALAGIALAMPVSASQVTVVDREASYPEGVGNVTHDPWAPERGDDVRVTLTLAPDARTPDAVSLLFCRVEPSYVCGIPVAMTPGADRLAWTGVIDWDYGSDVSNSRFIKDDTRHLGYNVTMRFHTDNGTERVSAPTGNFWIPETYPDDSEGVYYFLNYRGTEHRDAPGPAVFAVAGVLAAMAHAARRHHDGA